MVFDALFVINQNVVLSTIDSEIIRRYFKKVCILSTHFLFENERESFKKNNLIDFSFYTFSDFLNDEEMELCDNRATCFLLNKLPNNNRKNYSSLFMPLSTRYKNERVYDNFIKSHTARNIYVMEGLGIDSSTWLNLGGTQLYKEKENFALFLKVKAVNILKRFFFVNRLEVFVLQDNDTLFVFLSSTKRLHFKEGIAVKKYILNIKSYTNLRNEVFKLINNINIGSSNAIVYSSTIHNYLYDYSYYFKNINIFIDGFHPANYTRSYLDSYSNDCIFIVRNMLDFKWFSKFNKNVKKPYSFLETEYFSRIENLNTDLGKIILLLNHAGDWSALINRSDTDILIYNFVKLAKVFPNFDFIIRPHPTMIRPDHEGVNSINRIHAYVASLNLANLCVSNQTLEKDFEDGTIFISEYSQTLLDVYRIGKLGIIANFTNRRSYMEDYEKMGFISVSNFSDLCNHFNTYIKAPSSLIDIQNTAVATYNFELQKFIDENN